MTAREKVALETFRAETQELCSELEDALLELESLSSDDPQLINRVFRAMHTIKGSSGMFCLEEIAMLTHGLETLYDLVRSGQRTVTRELVTLSLSARDWIHDEITTLGNADMGTEEFQGERGEADRGQLDELMKGIAALLPGTLQQPEMPCKQSQSEPVTDDAIDTDDDFVDFTFSSLPTRTYRIRFVPPADLLRRGIDPGQILDDIRALGVCHVITRTGGIPPLSELDPEQCLFAWDVILSTDSSLDDIRDVFVFVEDSAEIRIDLIDDGNNPPDDDDYKRIGEILLERGDLSPAELADAIREKPMVGKLLLEKGAVDPCSLGSALQEQQQVRQMLRQRREQNTMKSVRVDAERLDELVNLVGELVSVQSRLSQATQDWDVFDLVTDTSEFISTLRADNFSIFGKLAGISEDMERLTGEIRVRTMGMRMVGIGTLFGRFKRLVRNLSDELGREVEFVTSGEETELDRSMIEKLSDPLVHLIRNSLDHGLESPDERRQVDKSAAGRLELSAEHAGNAILIRIRDDGRGLDPYAIRRRAIAAGLISKDDQRDEQALLPFIFEPGLSTATKVTDLSGRGVGLDVVKRSIESMRGSIEVQSTLGEGTTFTLRIPLTVAIIEGLLVRVSSSLFILPLLDVEECVELTAQEIDRHEGRQLLKIRGEAVPYISLRERFSLNGGRPERQQVVIMSVDGVHLGLAVDGIVGEHQTVIKSLGSMYRDLKCITGGSILGDGSIALILDVNTLYREVLRDRELLMNALARV